ncbi:MAG: ABC transporter ATP-binding protein [Ramlibacter sp.]|nr:ABC transporter ATP-binding protein [Ramlibacter sp.]
MEILEVRNLTTVFPTPQGDARAVNDVSFSLREGEILALVGESGCGKSVTALSVMNLIDRPGRVAGGEIRLRGENIAAQGERAWNAIRGKRIAMVLQDPMMALNPVIRIGDQLAETVRVHSRVTASQARELALRALEEVGIPAPHERLKAYPHELSGGMRQRVAIANAIINKPDVIIADEPTTALDVTIQAQILYQVKKLAAERGTAFVWITHDLSVVKDIADEVCVMYAGRIVERGAVAEVIADPRHPYTRGLIDSLPRSGSRGHLLKPIPGSTPPLANLPAGCAFAPRCPRATALCGQVPTTTQVAARAFACFNPFAQ